MENNNVILRYKGQLRNMFLNNKGLRTIKYLNYLDVYEKYLSQYYGTPEKPINILEIGIYEGGSLELYQKYIGEHCHVYGIDIEPKCKHLEKFLPNCKVFIGDAGSEDVLNSIISQLPKMDVIIDDGGHKTSQQLLAFKKLFPLLNDFGTYICEDLHTNYWKQYVDTEQTFVQYVMSRMELLNKSHDQMGFIPNEDELWTTQIKGVYFSNSIVCIEKKPLSYDLNEHQRTGEKTCF